VDAGGKIPTTAQQVDTITKRSKDDAVCTEAYVRAAEVRFFYLCHLGSNLSVHDCYFYGILPVY
jgi:hypothetical protein